MADLGREAFNNLLHGVELGGLEFPDVPVLGGGVEPPPATEEQMDDESRHATFMQNWADLQKKIAGDTNFNPTMGFMVLVDESTGASADINISMTKEEIIFWIEEAKNYMFKRIRGE